MKIAATVILKKGKEGSARRFHPWIFSGAIQVIDGVVQNGDWVALADSSKRILGFGHYQKGTIAVRLLSFTPTLDTTLFWRQKIAAAYQLRLATGVISPFTNAYRLVHGEGD